MDGEAGRQAPGGGIDRALRADARDVLVDLVQWQLTPERWERARIAIGRLAGAMTGDDAGVARDAVTDLELLGPVRVNRLGNTPTTPIPEPVREEVNELVHALDGRNAPSSPPPPPTTG